jgi:Domain of unknown function (DUF4214)
VGTSPEKPAVVGTTGNDHVKLSAAAPTSYDGGSGQDTAVIDAGRAAFTLTKVGDAWQAKDVASGNVNVLQNVERLEFEDVTVALDTDGVPGQAFRLYQAAFDRKPDHGGLGFWIGAMDKGASMFTVAHEFIKSPEFATLVGSDAPTDEAFVRALYKNVLHRDPDGDGYKWWVEKLHGGAAREDVLIGFSESAENQETVSAAIEGGIEYTPYAASEPAAMSLAGGVASVSGGKGADSRPEKHAVKGTTGNDHVKLSANEPAALDGGDGQDTAVVETSRAAWALTKVGEKWEARDVASGTVSDLENVERIEFDDVTVALDTDGAPGQAFRLYKAAFDRTPDHGGLGFWIGAMDKGASMFTVAHEFIESPEFATLVGTDAPTDEAFVGALYKNVLHRDADGDGYNWWLEKLHGGAAREDVLIGFSESAENQATVVGSIEGGIEFIPYA